MFICRVCNCCIMLWDWKMLFVLLSVLVRYWLLIMILLRCRLSCVVLRFGSLRMCVMWLCLSG